MTPLRNTITPTQRAAIDAYARHQASRGATVVVATVVCVLAASTVTLLGAIQVGAMAAG
jgi:hypothetical protein